MIKFLFLAALVDIILICILPKPFNIILCVVTLIASVIGMIISLVVINEELKKEQENNPY